MRADALTALYSAHALSLTRLGYVILGDRQAAEDVVQDAFAGLHRRWEHLADQGKAPHYLRSSVLNGCRTAIRRRRPMLEFIDPESPDSPRGDVGPAYRDAPAASSAELTVLAGEEQRAIMRALRDLPERQREVLILRFYLGAPDAEIARLMGIRESTVRSTAHRALAALGRILGKES